MRYKKIPKTDLNVSVIALGTWVFGGESWSGADDREAYKAIAAAADAGINFIDTAPIYSSGRSEEIVGQGIKRNRDQWIIATKCGPRKQGNNIVNDLSMQSIARQLDDSLRRLNIECIDLYQCHWPDPKTPVEKTMEYLNKAKQQGKIRHIGLSNFGVDLMRRAMGITEIVTLQSQYSLLERSLEEENIPFCAEQKIGVLAYGPLGGGVLTGKYRESVRFPNGDARQFFYPYFDDQFESAKRLLERMALMNKPLNQIALNWVCQQRAVVSALVGCRNSSQVAANAAAADLELTAQEISDLAEFSTPQT